jgi:glutathione S-transferase
VPASGIELGNTPMLTFWFSPGSSSMATHIALHEVGAEFEARLVSLPTGENREPEYLTINPDGKVPSLAIDGRILTEVAGTLYYLARRFPEARLLPAGDIEAEAQVVSWMSFIASTIHPARRVGVARLLEVFAIAEQKLGGRTWTVGDYSIADIHLFRLFWRWMNSGGPAPGTFPGISAHYDRMMTRPAVRRVLEIESAIGYQLPA